MGFLATFIAIVVITLIYMRFEASQLKVETLRFSKSAGCLKVAHLSDIHINKLKVSNKKIKKALERENPDLVIISGDYIESKEDIPLFLDFIEEIKFKDMFLCLGNHDYMAFKNNEHEVLNFIKSIESKGVKVLENEGVCFEKNSRKYNIIGISDNRYGHHDIDKALSYRCTSAESTIVFSHNPDVILDMPEKSVEYLLCGHFHGGQIWAPFNLEFKLMRREKLCKMGIRRGLHNINGINLYINRGIGNVVVPLRLFSRPEVAVFYIR